MCTSKAPKSTDPKVKDPQYLRNPWLDGISMTRAATGGRNALRIDMGSAARNYTPPPITTPPTPPPFVPPAGPWGGGGGGGGGGGFNPGGGGRLPTMQR